MSFGRLCVLCPSCLCCHGDCFIFKPVFVFADFVNVFVSDLLRHDNRFFFANPICYGVSQGNMENIAN